MKMLSFMLLRVFIQGALCVLLKELLILLSHGIYLIIDV